MIFRNMNHRRLFLGISRYEWSQLGSCTLMPYAVILGFRDGLQAKIAPTCMSIAEYDEDHYLRIVAYCAATNFAVLSSVAEGIYLEWTVNMWQCWERKRDYVNIGIFLFFRGIR